MGIRIQPHEIAIPADKPFTNDRLGGEKPPIRSCISLVIWKGRASSRLTQRIATMPRIAAGSSIRSHSESWKRIKRDVRFSALLVLPCSNLSFVTKNFSGLSQP